MRCAVYIFAILLVLNFVSAKTQNDKAYKKHLQRVNQFRCKAPQKRVIQLTEIFDEPLYSNEELYPSVTVLHRCDSSAGCCSHAMFSCAPLTSEIVQLVFHVTQINVKETAEKPNLRIISAVNHTICACQPIDLPK